MLRDKLFFFGKKLIEKGLWPLTPFALLYSWAVWIRNQLYDHGIWKTVEVEPVVVSIGNIVAGGSGKTPLVHFLASRFSHKRVAILSRGYGAVPDEALLLAKRLPNAKVFVGKNRALLAKQIEKMIDLIILDDGLQHRKLARDFDIALVPLKKERYFPLGFLRDSPKSLKRCDLCLTKGVDFSLKVEKIIDPKGGLVESIEGWEVAIFCAIANPEEFQKTVESLGAKVLSSHFFIDHGAIDLSKLPRNRPLICTEKDFVKLGEHNLPIYYLEVGVEMEKGKDRLEKLIEKIEKKIDNRGAYE